MKDVTVYQSQLTQGTLNYDWTAGDHNLQATFVWPTVEQEQWDVFTRELAALSASDPMIMGNKYVRDYDYIDYYTSVVPQQQVDRAEWFAEQTDLPASLHGKTYAEVLSVLEERVTLCQGFAIYKQELSEALRYQCTIVDEAGEVTVCDVIPGGFTRNQDNDWAIRFLADVDEVGRDQLGIVTVEVETYAEPSD